MSVKDIIKKRRAFRSLEYVDISDEIINDLAKTAQIAPSCMNRQPWRFIFIKSETQLKKLFSTLSEGNKWVQKASMIIGVYSKADLDCIIKDKYYYTFDIGLAVAFMILRATELGYVAHPIAGFNEKKAKEILEIPEEFKLITLIIIGKHSSEINPILSDLMKLGEVNRPPRMELNEFISMEKYNKIKKKEDNVI